MKPKKLLKKLAFIKVTIADIGDIGMVKIHGGEKSVTFCGGGYTCQIPTCNSCATDCNTCPAQTCMISVCPYEPC